MSAEWMSFFVASLVVATMLVLHGFIVMAEISLMKFRYGEVDEEALESLKKRRGWLV